MNASKLFLLCRAVGFSYAAAIGITLAVQSATCDSNAAAPGKCNAASQKSTSSSDLTGGSSETGGGISGHPVPYVVPLHGRIVNENSAPDAHPDELILDDANQCAGTVRHYKLPPTGYEPPGESSMSKKGKQLYEKLNCGSCHTVEGSGGTLGPPLDGIGGHRGEQFITARLLDPERQMRDFPEIFGGRPNLMPHPGVSRSQARDIAKYLLTLAEPPGGFLVTVHAPIPKEEPKEGRPEPPLPQKREHPQKSALDEEARKGLKAFIDHGCASCHQVGGTGGRFGPALDGIGTRRSEESIQHILEGQTGNIAMKSQSLELTAQEVKSITRFLMSLPPDHWPQPTPLSK